LAGPYPARTVCRVLAVVPSSHYYRPAGRDEEALRAAIEKLMGRWPMYGYRRITVELKRAGWSVNHKRVARLMAAMGLAARAKRTGLQPTSSHRLPGSAASHSRNARATRRLQRPT
jgi:transposase InsO family protein